MDYGPSAEPTIDTTELSAVLAQLGLSQYEERLRENGFEDWENVTDITETDMAELRFKRGDRRKLQHAINEYNSSSASQVEYKARDLPLSSGGPSANRKHSEQATRTTRRYRRHPRPDPNAPHKRKTAYVLFGEHARQDPALSSSSFAEIAKETGKRWRQLPHEERVNDWELPVNSRLQEYREELERYKQTENYWNYQKYLEEFKQQQHNAKSTIPSDDKSSPTFGFASLSPLLDSEGQEEFEDISQESVDTVDPNLEGQSQDTTSPVKSGMEEVRHISKALGINPTR
ncbi:hypothetical protein GQ44DRAFT_263332 [Phaeosphaeriaceae sp. PMI808]|nr:hypothetical protein GQ44DRAFT_263332 [Phaeosphaeriaceae sp. PMI808]